MKKGVIIVGLISALVLSGCSNTNHCTKNTNTVKTTATKNAVVQYYQNLEKAEKKQVKFVFDASKVSQGYDISVKIKNESKKQVKFKLSEFKIYNVHEKDIKSARDDVLVIKPHETCTIKKLFVDLKKSTLNNSTNYFIYYNEKNKLARFAFDIASGVDTKQANELQSSNENKPTTNEEAPKAVQNGQTGNSNTSTSNSGTSSNASGVSSSSTSPTAPAKILTSAQMARDLYLHSMNLSPARGADVAVESTGYGYKITDNGLDDGPVTYYNYAGDELDSSGNVIATFAHLAGPTAGEPEGFVQNGTNYNQY
ncbi:hypothetical protein [Companilactobacillus sp.]|uniref:hypothetical protein n=1 Tax=Companilactobacillus sp. TaxID=2767905 RepID=UPI0026352F1B|nr:hypothetical protein [Companilactobacillus sp.]